MGARGAIGPLVVLVGLVLGGLVAGVAYATAQSQQPRSGVELVTPPPVLGLQAAAGDASRGRRSYDRLCAGCHGADGRGDVPLHGPLLNTYYRDDATLAWLVRNGVGSMPSTPMHDLDDQGLADVVAFIRALP